MAPAISDPKKIEARSFEIIAGFLRGTKFSKFQRAIVERVIHATADFNYRKDLAFHRGAVEAGLKAIKEGKDIVADSSMLKAGIDKKTLSSFGGRVISCINDEDVIRRSSRLKVTRAMLAMRKAAKAMDGGIAAIGNAPTALFELCDLVEKGKARPRLVIGVPVGFVGAKEAKKKLRSLNIPYITNKSRKGGSSAASACVNALLKIAEGGESASPITVK